MTFRSITRATVLIGAALVLSSVLVARAAENETFGVTPSPDRVAGSLRRTFAIPLDPGSVFEDAVRVYNRTDQPLDLLVYPTDARAGLDGTISVGLRGSHPTGVGSWIKLDRSSLSLPRRGEAIVHFRVTVQSTRPSPELGAIVVENTARGPRVNLTQRLHVVVRTTPQGSTTTSTLVHALTFRSGWIILAFGGLIVAGVLVWLARRRAKRSRDDVAPPGASTTSTDDTPDASRPVLHRLGRPDTDPKLVSLGTPSETDELPIPRTSPRRRPAEADERPLLDEVEFIEDDDEDEDVEEVEAPARRRPKPAARAPRREKKPPPAKDLDYIPLDDL
jgi:hypothetical protein